jgi:hypothetical protein
LKSKTSSLATITKFGTTLKPTWTVRYKATSSAIVTSGVNATSYAAFENGGSGTLLTFDKNGKVTATNTFSGQPIALGFNKAIGLYLYTGENIYSFALK